MFPKSEYSSDLAREIALKITKSVRKDRQSLRKKPNERKIIDNANLYGQNVQLEGSIVFFRHAG